MVCNTLIDGYVHMHTNEHVQMSMYIVYLSAWSLVAWLSNGVSGVGIDGWISATFPVITIVHTKQLH